MDKLLTRTANFLIIPCLMTGGLAPERVSASAAAIVFPEQALIQPLAYFPHNPDDDVARAAALIAFHSRRAFLGMATGFLPQPPSDRPHRTGVKLLWLAPLLANAFRDRHQPPIPVRPKTAQRIIAAHPVNSWVSYEHWLYRVLGPAESIDGNPGISLRRSDGVVVQLFGQSLRGLQPAEAPLEIKPLMRPTPAAPLQPAMPSGSDMVSRFLERHKNDFYTPQELWAILRPRFISRRTVRELLEELAAKNKIRTQWKGLGPVKQRAYGTTVLNDAA